MSDVAAAADISAPRSPDQVRGDTALPASMSVSDAARILAERRKQSPQESKAAPEAKEPAVEAPTESADEADAAPPETEVPGEPTEKTDAPPETEAPIDAPRSWTKEARERWQSLPRETQEYLSVREQERDREVRRSQNETAEKLKGVTAKEQQLEQARQQYEAALPQIKAVVESQIAGEFSDIRSMQDVNRMASEDWPRYIRWDAAQKQLAAVHQEAESARQRQAAESQGKHQTFITEQDRLFLDRAPEMKDKATASKVQDAAIATLKDIGFSDDELGAMWNGQDKLSLRDHRAQLLIRDAVRYRQAQAKAKVPTPKSVPQVQRPGVSRPAGASDAERVQVLSRQLDKSGSLEDATALLAARRRARA